MKRNYGLIILVLVTFFVISFLTNILGALNPSVSLSFKLSETMAGLLPFAFFIAYGVMSIPAGFMLERYGEKLVLSTAFLLSFLGSLLFVIFPSFTMFLVSLFTIGSGMAMLQVVINPLLRVAGGEEHYAFNSVLAQLVFGGASFVSPMVYTWLVSDVNTSTNRSLAKILTDLVPANMSWLALYVLFSLMSFVMVLVILSIKFPKMELKEDEKVGSKASYFELFKNKTVILFFLGIFAYVGLEQGISYWMSKFLQVYHGYDFKTVGATAVANFWGLMTLGSVLGLVLLKLIDSKLVLRIFTVFAIIGFSIALFGQAKWSLYAFQGCGFFLAVMYPIIISLALNSVSKHHGAFAGILMSGIMGGAVVQVLIGFISDATSLKVGMSFVFVVLLYVLSISFWAKPIVKNKTLI
ncbi:MAG: MFS transporter [Flavobacteriaceae bacterium]